MHRGSIDLAFGSFLTCTPNNPAQDHGNEQLGTMIFSPMCDVFDPPCGCVGSN